MNYKVKIQRMKENFNPDDVGGLRLRQAKIGGLCRGCLKELRVGELYIKDDYNGGRFHYLCMAEGIRQLIKSYNRYKKNISQINERFGNA